MAFVAKNMFGKRFCHFQKIFMQTQKRKKDFYSNYLKHKKGPCLIVLVISM